MRQAWRPADASPRLVVSGRRERLLPRVSLTATLSRCPSCRDATGEWRNWQTRRIQVPVSARTWGFKSPLAHQQFCALQAPEPATEVHGLLPVSCPARAGAGFNRPDRQPYPPTTASQPKANQTADVWAGGAAGTRMGVNGAASDAIIGRWSGRWMRLRRRCGQRCRHLRRPEMLSSWMRLSS